MHGEHAGVCVCACVCVGGEPYDEGVYLFTSSTFTDTQHERDVLMQDVFPFLRRFCQSIGLSFTFADMRWGIRLGGETEEREVHHVEEEGELNCSVSYNTLYYVVHAINLFFFWIKRLPTFQGPCIRPPRYRRHMPLGNSTMPALVRRTAVRHVPRG